jgi:hypothetical protein
MVTILNNRAEFTPGTLQTLVDLVIPLPMPGCILRDNRVIGDELGGQCCAES